MKKFTILMFLVLGVATSSQAQILTFKASVGDLEMDNLLTDIHNQAVKDVKAFTSNVVSTFGIVNSKIEAALKILAPGDIYMAAQLSQSINKSFDEVVKTYQANKSKGWGAIAKDMGIKPGSAEFHAMKKSMKSKGGKGGNFEKGNGNSDGKDKGNGNGKGGGKKK